ncbi:MAG: methyl-accepting chemotaxis protein, partial [Burkholderiaceae bacterium]
KMNIKKLRIGQRLALGFGIVIALLIMLASLAYVRIASMNSEINLLVKDRYPKTVIANAIKADLNEVTRNMLNVLIMTDPGQIKQELSNLEEKNKSTNAAIATLGTIIADAQGREHLTAITALRDKFLPMQVSFVGLINQDAKDDAMMKLLFSVRPLQTRYFARLDDFISYQNSRMEQSGAQSTLAANRTALLLLVLAAIAGTLSVLVGVLVSRSITRPLNEAVDIAKNVADGDLTSTITVKTFDETGMLMDALRHMNESLSQIVGEVRSGTETIASVSSQIAVGNLDLSSRTEQQASALQQTAASMLALTGTVRENSDNAQQANQLAACASDVAAKGGAVVAQVIGTMHSINDSSRKIVDIIGVIDGIAFQTNILALNAAVEAARAGEQGRGFAVVASEVRSLAQRSAAAAKEIKSLIGDSVNKVEIGSKLVRQAGITMDEVVASVARVTDIMTQITAASLEQSVGIEQVNRAISQMDAVTQQNAALVEEAAASAESMQNQAVNLAQVVSVFKLHDRNPNVAAVATVAERLIPPARVKRSPAMIHIAATRIAAE